MQVIRKLNNNAVICKDSKGRELIALGKGIGFGDLSREITIDQVERTFYDLEEKDIRVMQDLPSDIVLFTASLLDIIKNELPYELTPNAVLLLTDHLSFAIERTKKKIRLKMPIAYDVHQMYPLEYKIGLYIVNRIVKEYRVILPKEEIAAIAMNIVNSKVDSKDTEEEKEIELFDEMLEQVTVIVESICHIIID